MYLVCINIPFSGFGQDGNTLNQVRGVALECSCWNRPAGAWRQVSNLRVVARQEPGTTTSKWCTSIAQQAQWGLHFFLFLMTKGGGGERYIIKP